MPGSLRVPLAGLMCVVVAVAAGALAACGDSPNPRADVSAALGAGTVTDEPQGFPRPDGESLREFLGALPTGPTLYPTVSLLRRGPNRLTFALYDAGRQEITARAVAVYAVGPDGDTVTGPYRAWRESLHVPSELRSRTTANDPDAPTGFYVARVPFDEDGAQTIVAVARLDQRLVASKPTQLNVGDSGPEPPRPGDRAPRIHTPTVRDVGGDLAQIDTRVPPTSMHDVDLASVLGRRPVVVAFATPGLCRTRVCSPLLDVVESVRARMAGRAVFVHMEVYAGNDISRGVRPQVRAFRLPSEPWTFVIDRRGRVSERFEGPVSARELRAAVQRVAGGA